MRRVAESAHSLSFGNCASRCALSASSSVKSFTRWFSATLPPRWQGPHGSTLLVMGWSRSLGTDPPLLAPADLDGLLEPAPHEARQPALGRLPPRIRRNPGVGLRDLLAEVQPGILIVCALERPPELRMPIVGERAEVRSRLEPFLDPRIDGNPGDQGGGRAASIR